MNDEPLDLGQFLVGPERLQALLREHCDFVRRCLSEPHSAWNPHLIVLAKSFQNGDEKRIMHVLHVPFNEDEEKRATMRALGRGLYEQMDVPLVAVLSSEAWTAERRADDPHVQPRHHPNRREVIVVFGGALGGKHCAMARMDIGRDADGRIVPGEFEPPLTEGLQTPLLEQFFLGFFEHVRRKFGHPAFREKPR